MKNISISDVADLKQRLESAKAELHRLTAQQEMMEKNYAAIEKDIQTMGVEPSELPKAIEELKEQTAAERTRIEKLIAQLNGNE